MAKKHGNRNQPGARTKLREYFLEHVGEILDSEVLRAVAGTSEWGRRIRELRSEYGMNIVTHNDRSDLKPGQYVLLDTKPLPAFERSISKETRAFVLDRNGFTCQMCGAAAGEPHPHDPTRKTRLHIGHIIDKSLGGTDDPSNLRAVCSVCNEGAANITLEGATIRVLPLGPDSYPEVLKIYQQCEDFLALGPQPRASMEMVVTDMALSAREGGRFCGIYTKEGGRLIGVADYVPKHFQANPKHAYLLLVMIARDWRSRGVGSEVVGLIEREIRKDPEIEAILSGVQVNNPEAIRFWERMGYLCMGRPELMPDGTTVYHLKKALRRGISNETTEGLNV